MKLSNQIKKFFFMNEKRVLLTIVLLAVFLRIGGNIVKQEVFFNEPFLLSGDAYRESIIYDAIWYNGTAKAFLKGKGLSAIGLKGESVDYPVWYDIKKVEGSYCAHKVVPPIYPLFVALCYYFGGENTLAYFLPQVILGSLTCLFIYFLAK